MYQLVLRTTNPAGFILKGEMVPNISGGTLQQTLFRE